MPPSMCKVFFKSLQHVRNLVNAQCGLSQTIANSLRRHRWFPDDGRRLSCRLSLSRGQKLLFPVYFRLHSRDGSAGAAASSLNVAKVDATSTDRVDGEILAEMDRIRVHICRVYGADVVFYVELFSNEIPGAGCVYFQSDESAVRMINDYRLGLEIGEKTILTVWEEEEESLESDELEELDEDVAMEAEVLHDVEKSTQMAIPQSSESGMISVDDEDIEVFSLVSRLSSGWLNTTFSVYG